MSRVGEDRTPGTIDPVLSAIVVAAVGATGASSGWLVALGQDGLAVVAGAGGGAERIGSPVDPTGPAGLALASGQPAARSPRPDDVTARGAGGAEGIPASVLCVPCGEFGAMELADKRGGPFTIDDVEVVTILADVAAAALSRTGPLAPGPDELALRLRSMAASDPERYATVAPAVAALLAGL